MKKEQVSSEKIKDNIATTSKLENLEEYDIAFTVGIFDKFSKVDENKLNRLKKIAEKTVVFVLSDGVCYVRNGQFPTHGHVKRMENIREIVEISRVALLKTANTIEEDLIEFLEITRGKRLACATDEYLDVVTKKIMNEVFEDYNVNIIKI